MATKPESQPMKRPSNIQVSQIRVGSVLEIKHKIPFFIGDSENLCGPDGTPCMLGKDIKRHETTVKNRLSAIAILSTSVAKHHLQSLPCWGRVGKEILMRFGVWEALNKSKARF